MRRELSIVRAPARRVAPRPCARRSRPLWLAAAILLGTLSCSQQEEPPSVDLSKREPVASRPRPSGEDTELHVAFGGMIAPRKALTYYLEFLRSFEGRLGVPVRYVDKQDYAEINAMLRSGEVDIAFVCSGPYVDGHDEFGLELLAAPQAYGQSVYHSYLIVPKKSAVRSLDQLRGRSFAFTDPLSNSGALVPTYVLSRRGETPESFFGKVTYTHSHDNSIQAVAQGLVDGAAVDSLIWEYENRTDPRYTANTRIVETSPPYGIPPVVVRPGLDPELKARIRELLLAAHRDPQLREAMSGMMVQRFVPVEDSHYDSVREMKRWLAAGGRPPGE